ncbi:MAG: type I-D CRISPR-associated protein Cas10d/Csc3, partial [Planktothrix sp.]
QNKKLPEIPDLDITYQVAEFWQLTEYLPAIRDIQSINESLKDQGLKGNTGGVPYEWYFLAAQYLEQNPWVENVREICNNMINQIADLVEPIIDHYQLSDGWDDLRNWVQQVIILT